MVVEVPPDDATQPAPYNWHRFVTPSHQGGSNRCQRCAHPFLDRQPDDFETGGMLTTAVRESQKVEGFRLSLATLPALLRGIASKSDKPRFVRVERQLELGKTFS
jgi:hypothetical protein